MGILSYTQLLSAGNRLQRNAIPPASWIPKAWKITIQGQLANNNILFSSALDCQRATNTLINDMTNTVVRTTSKYANTSFSQSDISTIRNKIVTSMNCGCQEVDNPNYNPESAKPMVNYGNPSTSSNNTTTNDNGTSRIIQGSIFDAPSSRNTENQTVTPSSQDVSPEINMDNLNAYINKKNSVNNQNSGTDNNGTTSDQSAVRSAPNYNSNNTSQQSPSNSQSQTGKSYSRDILPTFNKKLNEGDEMGGIKVLEGKVPAEKNQINLDWIKEKQRLQEKLNNLNGDKTANKKAIADAEKTLNLLRQSQQNNNDNQTQIKIQEAQKTLTKLRNEGDEIDKQQKTVQEEMNKLSDNNNPDQ